jgi:hypothetical protein
MRIEPANHKAIRRTGAVGVELLLLLPVFLVLALAIMEISLLLAAREQVQCACREGVRRAAQGGNEEEIIQAVRLHLGSKTAETRIVCSLRDEEGRPIRPGEPVAVRLDMPASAAVPDLMACIGFSLQGQAITTFAVMRKE